MEYVFPKFLQGRQDTLWLEMYEMKMDSQNSWGRSSINAKRTDNSWKFLAPNEIAENVSHTWGEYESMASRLAEKGISLMKGMENIESIAGAAKGAVMNVAGSGKVSMSTVTNMVANAASTNVIAAKIDSAYTYQDSNRREFSLTIEMHETVSDHPYEMYECVQKLKEASCAEHIGMLQVGFPRIFRIVTHPIKIININHAALTGVQPNWKSPYHNGYPCGCELTLTFVDIEPLYRESFSQGGIIKTGTK